MRSATLRKSVTDLTRRRARTVFVVATLALAVASISFYAVPALIDDAMQQEVRDGRVADLVLDVKPVELTPQQLRTLEALPNVAAMDARNAVDVRVLVGERRAPARLIGIRDFGRQSVDVVRVESGALPARREVLADVQNANTGVYGVGAGDVATLVPPAGAASSASERLELRVSGVGRDLAGGEFVQDERVAVLYASAETVAALSGEAGYGRLAFVVRDQSPAAVRRTVEDVRAYLRTVPGFGGFTGLPSVRPPGDWPGKDETAAFADFTGVITLLALLSAVVLVSNTMSTLVAEQTGEIGIMRAVGARRRQIAGVYVTTALLLGALGAAVGVVLGIVFSNLLAGFFGNEFWAVDVPFGVDPTVLLISVVVGLVAPALAALPAIRRGVRTDLREALESTGSAVGGQDAGDRLLRRVSFLPRTAQIGLRGVGRRRRRSLATALIVALAVGNLLAILGIAAGATEATRASWGDHTEDIRIWTTGRKPFDAQALRTIRATPGVARAEPALVEDVAVAGEEAVVWGMPREPLLRYRLAEGRWYDAAEVAARARVAVVERILAENAGIAVGDTVSLTTPAGPARFRVIGMATNQQEYGTAIYVPLTTVRTLLGDPTGVSTYWIRTTSRDEALIDRTMSALEDRLGWLGFEIGGELTYVELRDEVAANRTVTTSIAVLGFLIVAMSMVGLANAITTSVLERTREIGVLRCIGARGRDVRRIFAVEGVALAVAGWLLGIPLGLVLNRLIVWLVREVADAEIPAVFPPWNVLLALVGTVAIALLVLLLPIRRAVRLRPGDAIRYA